MFLLKLKSFFSSIARSALILFLALLGLSVVGFVYSKFEDYQNKKEQEIYKAVKEWDIDMTNPLKMVFHLKTRYVDGYLQAVIEADGYPDYLSDSGEWVKNRNNSLIFSFKDKDGFQLGRKEVSIKEFTRIADGKGGWNGLRTQTSEYMSLDSYKNLNSVVIEWTLNTNVDKKPVLADKPKPVQDSQPKPPRDVSTADHCAPGLSKDERIRRLGLLGTVRQTGPERYEAAYRSVTFYGGNLLTCN